MSHKIVDGLGPVRIGISIDPAAKLGLFQGWIAGGGPQLVNREIFERGPQSCPGRAGHIANGQVAVEMPAKKLGMDVLHFGISALQLVLRSQIAHLSVEARGFHRQNAAGALGRLAGLGEPPVSAARRDREGAVGAG